MLRQKKNIKICVTGDFVLSVVWFVLIFLSVVYGILLGNIDDVVQNISIGATEAVTLIISLTGIMCFWSGIMEIVAKSNLVDKISLLFSPLLNMIFKKSWKDAIARRFISSNFSANLMGLSNAATPMGLQSANRIYDLNKRKGVPHELIFLVVLNCSSVQLIPTTVAGLRTIYGSSTPFDILPAVWLTSIVSVTGGIVLAKIFSKITGEKQ